MDAPVAAAAGSSDQVDARGSSADVVAPQLVKAPPATGGESATPAWGLKRSDGGSWDVLDDRGEQSMRQN